MKVTLLTARKFPTTIISPSLVLLACLAWPLLASSAEMESLDSIRLSAERHALAQIQDDGLQDAKATAGSLDRRLQLKKCDTALESFTTGNTNMTSRITVGVRCNGKNPWTLYVPVSISALVDVVLAKRALTRGAVLGAEDLEIQQLAMDKLPLGYVSDPGQIIDFELIRPIRIGMPLTLSTVRPREIIQQGQEVIIVAQIAGLQVKMTGKALRNGQFGELIPVKNLRSGRTIEATIMSESTVSVNL